MEQKRCLALKITGKAFDEGPELLRKYVHVIGGLARDYSVLIVTGGGRVAREYIEVLRKVGVESNYWLDITGIWVSRLNALTLIAALSPHSYPKPVTSIEEAVAAINTSRVVVAGGLIPGQSTASVLLQIAEALGLKKVYYYSAVGKVYDKDPLKYPNAKALSVVRASELAKILEQEMLPGEYALIDLQALKIAIRSGIEVQVLSYREPEQIYEALKGGNPGTLILPE
ncbi:MAG: UMP kinase [Desulfurococcaceae archaeon]